MNSNPPHGKVEMPTSSSSPSNIVQPCPTSTPYLAEFKGPRLPCVYFEQQLAKNRFRITYGGKVLKSRERVESYLLYRAAELTVQEGFDWFHITNSEANMGSFYDIEKAPCYQPSHGYNFWLPYWRYYTRPHGWHKWSPYGPNPFWLDDIDIRTVEQFEVYAEIEMALGLAPCKEIAFDARLIREELGSWIARPNEG